jgi:oxalate decarboxylase
MSDLPRRDFVAAAAAFVAVTTGALMGPKAALAGDPSFQNNVPDPLLAGEELPTFKFELEKSEGKVIGNSYGKEATVKQLPISKGISGVSMKLEPGAMRELHWHATAAEWAFVIEGKVRVTIFGSHGRYRTETLSKGDVGYIPQGYGHSIENISDKPCRVPIG